MQYRRCGNSGLMLPALSLGMWHNFGYVDMLENCRAIARTAFDNGITHFDLANNYGPPPGAASQPARPDLRQRAQRQHPLGRSPATSASATAPSTRSA